MAKEVEYLGYGSLHKKVIPVAYGSITNAMYYQIEVEDGDPIDGFILEYDAIVRIYEALMSYSASGTHVIETANQKITVRGANDLVDLRIVCKDSWANDNEDMLALEDELRRPVSNEHRVLLNTSNLIVKLFRTITAIERSLVSF